MLWICKRVSIWILDYTLIQREESRSFVFSIVTRVWQFTLRSKKLTFFKTVLESRSFPCPKYFLPFYNQWYFHSEIDSNYDDLRFLDFASFRFKNVKKKRKGLFVSKSLLRSMKRQIATRVRPRIETLFASKKNLEKEDHNDDLLPRS